MVNESNPVLCPAPIGGGGYFRQTRSCIGLWLFVGIACLVSRTDARPAEISADEMGYVVRHWGIEDGLPLDRLTSLAQTPEGFLWIGTDDQGLSRFDGSAFFNLNPLNEPMLPGWRITELMTDASGKLWIRSGDVLGVRDEGRFELLSPNRAGPMAEDGRGRIHVQHVRSFELRLVQNNLLDLVSAAPSTDSETAGKISDGIECDPWNRIWGVGRDHTTLYELTPEGGVFPDLSGEGGVRADDRKCLLQLPDGNLGLLTGAGLFVRTENEWILRRAFSESAGADVKPRVAVCDSEWNVWIGTAGDRLVFWGTESEPRQMILPEVQSTLRVRDIVEDADKNIWVASHSGLFRFSAAAFRTLVLGDGSRPRVHDVAAARDGSVWFLNHYHIFRLFPNGRSPTYVGGPETFQTIGAGKAGVLYGVKEGVRSFSRLDRLIDSGENAVRRSDLFWEAPEGINFVFDSPRNGLWVGTDAGVYLLPEETALSEREPKFWPLGTVAAIDAFDEARVMVLTKPSGLHLKRGQDWQDISGTLFQGRSDAVGFTVSTEGVVWVSFRSAALACWHNGIWRSFTSAQLDLPDGAMGIVSDLEGGLWWNTYGEGVFHLDADSAMKLAEGRSTDALTVRFGLQDGLKSLAGEGYEDTPVRDIAGRIWVPTAVGVSVIDPAAWRESRVLHRPPQLHLDAVRLDGRPISLRAKVSKKITIPAGVNRVEIGCSLIELSSPDRVFFRYRLTGYDPDWVTARNTRNLHYQKLPPGEYVLEAQAANQFLQWSDTKTLVTLVKQPFWWQRGAVRAAGMFFAAGAVLVFFQRKMRKLEADNKRQEIFSRKLIESQEQERLRIARELHDSLGQNLSIVRNTLYLAENAIASGGADSNTLNASTEMVDHTIAELRDISHNLRPHLLARLGLSKTLQALVEQIQKSGSCDVRLIMDPIDGVLSADSEIYLYRVVQETLNNVVKHAEAREVSVRLYLMAGRLYVDILDDGKGFDLEKTGLGENPHGGMGLVGIRERVKILGGEIEIRSGCDRGTEINIILPLKTTKE